VCIHGRLIFLEIRIQFANLCKEKSKNTGNYIIHLPYIELLPPMVVGMDCGTMDTQIGCTTETIMDVIKYKTCHCDEDYCNSEDKDIKECESNFGKV